MVLDTRINTYSDEVLLTSVTSLTDGGFVVTWGSVGQEGIYGPLYHKSGIYGQRYDASGNPRGAEFLINSYTIGSQGTPSVTSLTDGGFVVTWESEGQDDGFYFGIYGQRYDASGNPRGAEFRINTYTQSHQLNPSVTSLTNGGFVVTWESDSQEGISYDIYGQRYDASGNPRGAEFRINTNTAGYQAHASVTSLTDSGFVVTWESVGQGGNSYDIYGQRYDASGNPRGAEFRINTYATDFLPSASVTSLTDGGFVVTWESPEDIYGQRYDASGNPRSAEFRINTDTTGYQAHASVTGLADGGFVVTWSSSGHGIFGKRFDANGNEVEWNGAYNPDPENPLPENPNLGLETTSNNIIVAALNLSARAYSDAHHGDLSVSSVINEHIKNWKPLEATDLGFSATDSRFSKVGVGDAVDGDLLRFDYFHASATVGLTMLDGKRTLGIAFEGTNFSLTLNAITDLLQDVSYLKGYYNLLKDSEFIPSVVDYINTNDIEQVLVTGHSLGAAAAQSFMNDYGRHDARFMGVTFGSPGTLQLQPLPKDRFVNIQHNGDPVVNASQHITHQNIVHGAIINADVEDSGVDGLLREHTLYTPLDNSKASYRETIEFITSQLDAKTLFQDMNIVPGTDGDDNLNARAGKNGEILLGGRGNDTLKGGLIDGLDTQIFKGGLGNDTIDGDGGVDYAMYGGARSNFILQKDNMVLLNDFLFPDKWTISDQRLAPGSEGVDTLESIERLNFTDSALAPDLHDSAGKAAKLIGAVFGAESVSKPEYVAVGLYYLDNGTSYEDLATGAIQLAGANTPEQVVTLLWTNVVGSPPTTDQMQPFVNGLDPASGKYTTGSLGVLAAEYGVNLTNINLTGLVENGIVFDPSYYQPIG